MMDPCLIWMTVAVVGEGIGEDVDFWDVLGIASGMILRVPYCWDW